MILKDKWVGTMTQALSLKHPDVPIEELKKKVSALFDKKFKDTKCEIYNNYEDESYPMTLAGVIDWLKDENPIICESGCFFYQKEKVRSLYTEIIKETFLDAREIHKQEMFKAMDMGDTKTELIKSLQQKNDKKGANSSYGAEAEKSSFLYNAHSAMSITASGRGQLSVMMQTTENFFADNVTFYKVNDFMTVLVNIVNEKPEWKFDTSEYIPEPITRKKFIERFKRKFLNVREAPVDSIGKIYDGLDDEMRKRLYYKCNIREFFMLPKIREIFIKIDEINSDFVDPNKVPPEIRDLMKELSDLVIEFVSYKYVPYKYEDRSKTFKRKACVISDTDSIFIYCDSIKTFIMKEILHKKDTRKNELPWVNVALKLSSDNIANTLWNYLNIVHVPDEDKKYVKAKNEFLYSIIVTTYAMKSYFGLQVRQEEVILDPPVLDVKGVNFFKSTASKKTTDFIYSEILMAEILNPADGEIKLKRILNKITTYQKEMETSIAKGDIGYLKSSVNVKSKDGYANPMSIGQYRAVYVWNQICEQSELIELPATVILVKVKMQKKEDLIPLADYPEMYNAFLELFDDPMLQKEVKDKDKNVKGTEFGGIKAVAIPSDYDEVPEWLLSIIDVETIVQDNMKLFTQLYSPLGLVAGQTTHNGESMKYYTNIIKI